MNFSLTVNAYHKYSVSSIRVLVANDYCKFAYKSNILYHFGGGGGEEPIQGTNYFIWAKIQFITLFYHHSQQRSVHGRNLRSCEPYFEKTKKIHQIFSIYFKRSHTRKKYRLPLIDSKMKKKQTRSQPKSCLRTLKKDPRYATVQYIKQLSVI